MMQRPGEGNDDSYEAVLTREDRQNRKIWLIGLVILTLAWSSFLDVRSALFYIVPLVLCGVASGAWQARCLVRTGYVARGRAMGAGVFQILATTLILAATVWIQMRFGLWFTQYLLNLYD